MTLREDVKTNSFFWGGGRSYPPPVKKGQFFQAKCKSYSAFPEKPFLSKPFFRTVTPASDDWF